MNLRNYTPLFILAAVISTPYVFESEFFQKVAFPESYWDKQVNVLEAANFSFRSAIASCLLDIQKIQRTAGLDAAQLRLQGVPPEQVAGTIRSNIDATIALCKTMQEMYAQNHRELSQARAQLTRYARNM